MNECLPICNPYITKIELATMLNPISNTIENVWESWSIRVVMLFSLYLQIFLTICSPLRRRMNNTFIQIFIWLAYLMADSAAIFCVGHIASSQISSNKIKINTQNHLLALWAPFLMVHLGGPDTIAAFSIEDNQLWRRHMLAFITQFLFCAYVFLLTVPGNRLWIPIVLVFVVGIIKYGERIYAMYRASTNDKWLGKNMNMISIFLMKEIPRSEQEEAGHKRYTLGPGFSLRVIEVMMNLYYDNFFTKLSLHHRYFWRFVTISCLLTALGLFLFEEKQYKQGFDPFDITVTYTLICGAMSLDIIALFMHFFSDRVFVYFPTLVDFSFMKSIIHLKRTRWSNCKQKPYTKFTQLSTLLPFRKWNESISGFNIISYSRYMMRKQPCLLHYFNMFSRGSSIFIFMWLNEVKNPFLLELWDFIYTELEDGIMDSPHRDNEIELRVLWRNLVSEEIQKKLIPYIKGISLEELIIMWHIATHLCYVQELGDEVDKREFSKLLSDYMMYLLVLQSDIISHEQSYIKRVLDDVQGRLEPYFINRDEDEVEACKRFVADENEVDIDSPLTYSWNNACMLAKELGMISEASIKWEIISRVWVQLLYLAACKCSFPIHVQHLSKGGELISLVRALHDFTYNDYF